jgi:hypothetical protein
MIFYTVDYSRTVYNDSEESLETSWFFLDELPEKMLENMRRTLNAFVEYKKTRRFQLF